MRLVGVALLFTVRAARAAAGADAGAGPPHPDAAAVSWLTVEANEGGSSGGHTALRLGDEVFHFQHEAPGRLRLHRDPLATFHHEYALLGNRGVREARIPVSADTFELLRDTFVRRQLVEDAELAEEAARRQDVAWVELLLRRRAAGPDPTPRSDGLALPALGFFLGDGSAAPASPGSSHALAALRARIERERGPEFLERREAALRAALVASPLPAPSPETPALDPDRLVAFPPTASARDVDRETALHALALLRAAPALRPDAAADRDSPELALRPGEAEALRSAAAALEGELAELVASPRPGWGPPFALGLARLAAIDASLAGDRLVLLDAFPDDAATVTLRGDAGARHAAWLEREMRAALERARARALGGAGFREIDWSALETAASRLGDARRARANGAPLRLASGVLVPSRAARRGDLVDPAAGEAALVAALAAARASADGFGRALDAAHPYSLLTRNCVTELFATIDAALAEAPEVRGRAAGVSREDATAAASRARLGGRIDGRHGLVFIPAVSAGAVEEAYAAAERLDWPSYREERFAEMARREPPWRVALRESNTVTSTLYEPAPEDSAFLFFSEDAPALRPLLGALNFTLALGDALFGVAALPFAGPQRLDAGLRGALFSLPELASWSLRKGSMAFVDDEDARAGDASRRPVE
ncbi:MAG TPA: hypothetical protein VMW35_13025 [Myxococcota bacterium]|nr:hypothetical protein [Myxococcota bacterium]